VTVLCIQTPKISPRRGAVFPCPIWKHKNENRSLVLQELSSSSFDLERRFRLHSLFIFCAECTASKTDVFALFLYLFFNLYMMVNPIVEMTPKLFFPSFNELINWCRWAAQSKLTMVNLRANSAQRVLQYWFISLRYWL